MLQSSLRFARLATDKRRSHRHPNVLLALVLPSRSREVYSDLKMCRSQHGKRCSTQAYARARHNCRAHGLSSLHLCVLGLGSARLDFQQGLTRICAVVFATAFFADPDPSASISAVPRMSRYVRRRTTRQGRDLLCVTRPRGGGGARGGWHSDNSHCAPSCFIHHLPGAPGLTSCSHYTHATLILPDHRSYGALALLRRCSITPWASETVTAGLADVEWL